VLVADADVDALFAEYEPRDSRSMPCRCGSGRRRWSDMSNRHKVFVSYHHALVSKYARVAHPDIEGESGRTRIKQKYTPRLMPIPQWYPPKWALNIEMAAQPSGPSNNCFAPEKSSGGRRGGEAVKP
jgi:hypothetical protein